MKKLVAKPTLTKLKRLADIAHGLQRGDDYPITRLTTLKSLCAENQKAAAHFALHLATLAARTAATHRRPQSLALAAWREQNALLTTAVKQLGRYVQKRTQAQQRGLYETLAALKEVNNEYQPFRWGPVRIIQNRSALIVEHSFQCVLAWTAIEAGFWAYHAARDYAEQYDPRYGTGLIPESAPMVKEILGFWCTYYKVKP
jgi:hypothetical protein